MEKYAHKSCGELTALYSVILEQNEIWYCKYSGNVNPIWKMWGVSIEQLHQDALLADRNRGYGLYNMENLVNSMVFDREPINLLLNADASGPRRKQCMY